MVIKLTDSCLAFFFESLTCLTSEPLRLQKGSVNLSYKVNIFHFLFPFKENETTKIILISDDL